MILALECFECQRSLVGEPDVGVTKERLSARTGGQSLALRKLLVSLRRSCEMAEFNLKPLGDRVIIQPFEDDEVTASGDTEAGR